MTILHPRRLAGGRARALTRCAVVVSSLAAALAGWSRPAAAATSPTFSLDEAIAAHATLRLDGKSLISAPGARYVAWIEGRKLHAASEPSFEPRVLVTAEGKIVAAYASPDGRTLLFLKGAATPAFPPYPAEDLRELWRVDVQTGRAERLAQGADVPEGEPAFAPDGRSFVTAEGRMLYRYSLDGGSLQRRPLLENDPQHYAATHLTNVTFSPDGRKLAYVSWRKAGQSYVTVLDLEKGDYRYVDPGIFKDVSPVWSPDGREVAFARVPGNWTRAYRFSPQKEGAPWSLMAASVADGKVRTVWRADPGAGSVFRPFGEGSWMEANIEAAQLIWTRSGRILFPWEKTGWTSLYSVAASGSEQAKLLTPGQGEITLPELSTDGRSVTYASNVDDTARLHLWRVPVDGGAPQRLTKGNGVEHSPRLMAGGAVAYIGNLDGRMPNRMMAMLTNGRAVALAPSTEESAKQQKVWQQFVGVSVVPVKAADGLVTHHLVMVPKDKPPKEGYPVIIASKGGPDGRVSPGNGAYTALGQYAASRGYVFVEINYRGCEGFGLDYRLPEGRGATGGSEVKDLEALALYLRGRGDVDASRIGIMGGSYGGHLVSLALARLPQYFAAGVHMSGVSDWVLEMKMDQSEEGWPSAPPEFIRLSERTQIEDLAFESSPQFRIEAWKAPTLITMGELDTSGHMQGVVDLGYRLIAQGTHVEFSIAPEAGHTGPRARPPEKAFEFFERVMRRR